MTRASTPSAPPSRRPGAPDAHRDRHGQRRDHRQQVDHRQPGGGQPASAWSRQQPSLPTSRSPSRSPPRTPSATRPPAYTGTVHFTSTRCDAGTVLPADYTFTVGRCNATAHTPSARSYKPLATRPSRRPTRVTASITGTSNTIAVAPNALLGQVATTDADFKNTDGFDVLFTKGSSGSNLKLKNTNPGNVPLPPDADERDRRDHP